MKAIIYNQEQLPNSIIEMLGKKYGKLLIQGVSYKKPVFSKKENRIKKYIYFVKCKCDCGKEKIINAETIKRQKVFSCGCYIKEKLKKGLNVKHGLTNHRLYHIWCCMKNRCYNVNYLEFKYWGGKGVSICDEWKNNFENFYNWAIDNGYKDNLSIDRIDGNKNYCPENCRWATAKEQANNQRNNKLIFYKNQTKTLAEWCNFFGVKYSLVRDRIYRYNWSFEKAITTKRYKK